MSTPKFSPLLSINKKRRSGHRRIRSTIEISELAESREPSKENPESNPGVEQEESPNPRKSTYVRAGAKAIRSLFVNPLSTKTFKGIFFSFTRAANSTIALGRLTKTSFSRSIMF